MGRNRRFDSGVGGEALGRRIIRPCLGGKGPQMLESPERGRFPGLEDGKNPDCRISWTEGLTTERRGDGIDRDCTDRRADDPEHSGEAGGSPAFSISNGAVVYGSTSPNLACRGCAPGHARCTRRKGPPARSRDRQAAGAYSWRTGVHRRFDSSQPYHLQGRRQMMSDFMKFIPGKPTCRDCVHRRVWGLSCGCRTDGTFPHRARHGDYLWCRHYTDTKPEGEDDGQ